MIRKIYQKLETLCTVSVERIYLDGQVQKQGLCVAHPNDRKQKLVWSLNTKAGTLVPKNVKQKRGALVSVLGSVKR